METIKKIEKEIKELSEQFKDMLTVDEPQDLDEYPEEEWKEVYGDDLFFSDTMQNLMKKKLQLETLKKFDKLSKNIPNELITPNKSQDFIEGVLAFDLNLKQKIQGK